jgi:hypothetical protein
MDIDPIRNQWTPFGLEVFRSIQRGLVGEVTPTLRAVQVCVEENSVRCRAIYDRDPSEIEHEAMSNVETQMFADLAEGTRITFEVLNLDSTHPIPKDWPSAYQRME